MDTVKWGILGTANIARWATIPGIKLAKNASLYAVAGRSLEKAKSFADEYGFEKYYGSYDELLADKDVQAVYVPLPNGLHKEWVIKALKAKKHVLCEKPLALNASDAEEMFAAANENGVNLMEAYAYLHSPYVQSLKADVKSGIIGDVDFIDTAFVTQGYKEDIRLYKELGGGAFYDLGCYCSTMILSLIDSQVVDVKAAAEFTDKGVDAMTTGFVRFENGARASFNVGMIFGQESNSRFDRLYVHGSKGCIKSDVEYNQAGKLSYTIHVGGKTIKRKVKAPQNYSLEIQNLSDCVLNGASPFVSQEFSIKNAKFLDAVFKEIGW